MTSEEFGVVVDRNEVALRVVKALLVRGGYNFVLWNSVFLCRL